MLVLRSKALVYSVIIILCFTFFDHSSNWDIISATKPVISQKPNGTEIIQQLTLYSPDWKHPRIIARIEDFQRIKSQLNEDPFLKTIYKKLKQDTDKMLLEMPVCYELPDGVRLLEISRKALRRITNLAILYRLTDEAIYAERAWLELETICNPKKFPDWHPVHYLDTAEMAAAAAIGFDWLYDYLDDAQKRMVVTAIEKNAFDTAIAAYRESWWPKAKHNWNSVCNGGIGISALAIGDESPALAKKAGKILAKGIESLPIMMEEFGPDGGWGEGVGYWDYANTYVGYFIASLDSALGTDYGLSNFPGYAETGNFPIYLTGSNGTFNFADGGKGKSLRSAVLFWLATKFNKPEYACYQQQNSGSTAFDLLWYQPAPTVKFHQDHYFRKVEVVGLHSQVGSNDDIFVGFKAGNNQFNHCDLDLGTFVVDAFGKRWVEDLGKDNYNLPGYFDKGPTGKRWTYYRKRAEGHNTVVINPNKEPDQSIFAKTQITKFKSSEYGSFAIADLSPAYPSSASRFHRGAGLTDNRTRIIIQDELELKTSSEVWWFVHTIADIQIIKNGRAAMLSQGNHRMYVQLLSPQKAVLTSLAAVPLPTSPDPPGQEHHQKNPYRKLAIHLNDIKQSIITVVMIPLGETEVVPEVRTGIRPLSEWSVENLNGSTRGRN